jgi:hypothetical protein
VDIERPDRQGTPPLCRSASHQRLAIVSEGRPGGGGAQPYPLRSTGRENSRRNHGSAAAQLATRDCCVTRGGCAKPTTCSRRSMPGHRGVRDEGPEGSQSAAGRSGRRSGTRGKHRHRDLQHRRGRRKGT